MQDQVQQFAVRREDRAEPIFVGAQEVAQRCFEAVESAFFFVAGSTQPRQDLSPYSIAPVN